MDRICEVEPPGVGWLLCYPGQSGQAVWSWGLYEVLGMPLMVFEKSIPPPKFYLLCSSPVKYDYVLTKDLWVGKSLLLG